MKFDRLDAADCIRHKLRALGFGRTVYRQHVFPLKLNLHLPRFDKPGNRSPYWSPLRPRHAGVSWNALLSKQVLLWSFNARLRMFEITWAREDGGSIYSEVSRLEDGSIVGVEVRRTTRRPNRHGNAAKAPSIAVVTTSAGLDALGTAACSLSRMQPWRGQCHMRLSFYFCVTEKSMIETTKWVRP